jgi:thiol-disulfide isomerase/thioredoxin
MALDKDRLLAEARRLGVPAAALVAVLGLVLYGMAPPGGKEAAVGNPACAVSQALARKLVPLAHGEVAAMSLASASNPLPPLGFATEDGTRLTLADFAGRTVLLNLWATWCLPCRKEMPALDRLQGLRGSDGFSVVAVNIDTAKLDRVKAFWTETGVANLTFYADSTAETFQALKQAGKVLGLPTTILVGPDGCEIGTMAGPAQWDSRDALALVEAARG